MIIEADKERILEEFNEKYVQDRCVDEFKEFIDKYRDYKESIEENLTTQFDLVCKEAILLQQEKLKGEIKYIYFSFLRTSILENKGEWRIDLYDQKWFLDKEECSININLDFIYKHLFNHMDELLEKKNEYGRNIDEMDIESIKLKEADKYHSLTIYIIKAIIENLLESSSYKEMKKKKEIVIRAGEYMDHTILLYPKN